MTSDEHATPALLMAKPTWLITQLSAQAHRLLGSHLATVGARGYHFRLLAALAESGPASQASLARPFPRGGRPFDGRRCAIPCRELPGHA